MKKVLNDLFDYENRYIYQYEDAFKFSLDSLLLGEFVDKIKENEVVVDLCTGNAPVPLLLTTKNNCKITAFEIQKDIYKLGKDSIEYNKLEDKITLINDDIKNILNYYKYESIDKITCNPPYFKLGDTKVISESKYEKIARHETNLNLEDIFTISKNVLKNKGKLYLVHRSVRIDEIIEYASKYSLNVKEIIFIATKEDNINTVLVKCVKNSKKGVKIQYKNINEMKTYKNIF